jgi:8-oxo-dGTP pyrophosphatase MutT (NUDIX family)
LGSPVAAAVITSRLDVLVGRCRDGNPPWVFPAGKIEPGESPEEAAVREALEETGLRVGAAGVIGGRVHPRTGVWIVYVGATCSRPYANICGGRLDADLEEVGNNRTKL